MSDAIPVLVNRQGGAAAASGEKLREEIDQAFATAGLVVEFHLLDGCDIARAAADVADRPLVVVGGGDGTLGCAAGALLGDAHRGSATLGILPLGTRNHLARELGVPMDLAGAAKLIAGRHTRTIDVARVNGRLFVNNASVGFYPAMVRLRDAGSGRLPKWLAALPASWNALKRLRHHRLHLHTPDADQNVVTPMLFVGNNHYTLEAGQVGKRDALDDGVLSVFAVAANRRRALIGLALRTIRGRADPAQDFAAVADCASLTVTGRSRHIDIALDGEVVKLRMPLEFTIEPGALTVVAPPA